MKPLLPILLCAATAAAEPIQISGIYPSLAMFNNEGECGTGALVPWADRLWAITYAPHAPAGSSDKLYEITPDLEQIIRSESIGGTPANRMIHDESNQLFIGPYVIDPQRNVRTIPNTSMFGRLTGNARSLTDPSGKILFATMEEGIYQVDVNTLTPETLWNDEQSNSPGRKADLPGYHGKGFYSGQGVYVYANNGDHSREARTNPTVPSGVLAEWDGKADAWKIIRRNQFTDVTGPGGIHGNPNPATDPIWTIGWDAKSLLLGVRMPASGWSFYRLPKGSHSYDGAHGWNTEWPRIREIGENELMMTMHGTFWKFPKSFTPQNTAGIRPRSNYLKVIGDFCRWNDRLVFGCNDTARNEFLNKRKAKGNIAPPQSQSNLWFTKLTTPDHLGPTIGRGALWMHDDTAPGTLSDPYLFAGYDYRGLHLSHSGNYAWNVTIETGNPDGSWTKYRDVVVSNTTFVSFDPDTPGEWIRLRSRNAAKDACAAFTYRNQDPRRKSPDPIFNGIARHAETSTGGILKPRDQNAKTLSFANTSPTGEPDGYYELDANLELKRTDDPQTDTFTRSNAAIPPSTLSTDAASVIFTDDDGKRWRLPKGDAAFDTPPPGGARLIREVATERDLLNAHGTFYEVPANNAGGIAKMRPVATHNRFIQDFCSYRGLYVLSGISTTAPEDNPHIIRSDDGKTALWVGATDDIWKLGKPRGIGGPWKNTKVKAGTPSDPYLMTAYDRKSLQLSCDDPKPTKLKVTAQIDIHGDGTWIDYQTFNLESGKTVTHPFPDAFSAYWIRFVSDKDSTLTATLTYQ